MADQAREFELWADQYVRRAPLKAAITAANRADAASDHERASAAAILAALERAVRCRRCGRRLRTQLSKERGIGPECITKAAA